MDFRTNLIPSSSAKSIMLRTFIFQYFDYLDKIAMVTISKGPPEIMANRMKSLLENLALTYNILILQLA